MATAKLGDEDEARLRDFVDRTASCGFLALVAAIVMVLLLPKSIIKRIVLRHK